MAVRSDTESPLGDFLKTRRVRLTPDQVGLNPGIGTRRTPGLRREELATLAGISNDYYVRLERGKERRPSPAVIESLARALLLDEAERAHLRDLARQADKVDTVARVTTGAGVPVGVARMLEALRPYPALVTNRIGDFVAWNAAGLRLLPGLSDWSVSQRNAVRYGFLHPAARDLFVNWEEQVTGLVTGLRQLSATEPAATDVSDLVAELAETSADFRRLWDRYDIDLYLTGSQELRHPLVGELTIDYQVLEIQGEGGLTLMAYHAEPGSPEYEAFARLDA